MIKKEQQIIDNFQDEPYPLLLTLKKRKGWNKSMATVKADLIKLLTQQKFKMFTADPQYYGISAIGDSYLLKVPKNQRGHLSSFRGKMIRLVCVGTGRYKREYMAGIINQ